MRGIVKLITSVVMVLTLVVTSNISSISASAACTNWTPEEEHVRCDYSEDCWSFIVKFPAVAYNYGIEIRYCDDGNNQTKYSRPYTRRDGCCA